MYLPHLYKTLAVCLFVSGGFIKTCSAQEAPTADAKFTADEKKMYFEGPPFLRRSSLETGISLHSSKARLAAMRDDKDTMSDEIGKAVDLRFELAKLYIANVDKPDLARDVLEDLTSFYSEKNQQDTALQVTQLANEKMLTGQILQIAQFQKIIEQNDVLQQQNHDLFLLNEKLLGAIQTLVDNQNKGNSPKTMVPQTPSKVTSKPR